MKKNLLLFICFVAFISCNNENEYLSNEDENSLNGSKNYEVILKERDTSYPLILSNKTDSIKLSPIELRASLTFKEYLGRSYKNKTMPIGSGENIFYPVIDIKKMDAETSYLSDTRIGTTDANGFAYLGFDRYVSNSKIATKVSTGNSLNLGLFSIGSKRKMEEVFSSSIVREQKRVFGELNAVVRDARYLMQTSSYIYKKIILNYLTPEFKDELYNTTPNELYKNYGSFVLSSFVTGGSAIALYTGKYTLNESAESIEKNMEKDISASYEFEVEKGVDGKVSGDFGIGKNFAGGESASNKIEQLQVSVRTIGGSPHFSSFTVPKSIDNINVDLSQWISSLSNKDTHSIIEIADEGLIPLTNFIMEENLNLRIGDLFGKEVNEMGSLGEPHVQILYRKIQGFKLIIITLVTRFGDHVLLGGGGPIVHDESEVNAIVEQIKREKMRIYKGLKIIYKFMDSDIEPLLPRYGFDYELKENEMKKYVDTKNNTIYLLHTNSYGKFGLSIHNDYILDTYTIRDFVNSLPSIQMAPEMLFDYKIVAL